MNASETNREIYLECEKRHIFLLLMFVGGFYGAYTYSCRGGVFCNAQTANFVLFSMKLGQGEWLGALYYLIPMSAYLLGSMLSELLPGPIRRRYMLRWDTLLIGIEMLVVLLLGFIPDSAPFQISQVAVNLICSMQYNTFRQARGIPMATTFCTNHLRQLGISLVKYYRHPGTVLVHRRMTMHSAMLVVFVLGGILASFLCRYFSGRTIWMALVPLAVIFVQLLYADRVREVTLHDFVPRGH
ncbi:YoaK family protein [Faecalibaculum rodentium]|jgi:uncharacterized membrane protein YoaK (UPF0700 family)|uniref:YoaK family protein n=2 Tax=Faecalibaculum rodentium TaxID=1702221 RepID=UPI001C3D5E6F|nr:YoaK family protein [Faecalibaculum rodentium]